MLENQEKWNIVADSSCDLKEMEEEQENISFSTVPFVFDVGEDSFVDDESLDVKQLIDSLASHKEAGRSACPAPDTWLEKFRAPGNVFALTISSNLSGSHQSACIARDMLLSEEPERKIAVLDSRSTGPEIVLMVRKICSMIRENIPFEAIAQELDEFVDRTHIVFALSSFDNLVKNGRVSRLAGFVAGKLGLWGIGIGSDEGRIVVKNKVRGAQRALANILNEMKENAFSHGPVVISHCLNEELALKLKEKIVETWENAQVKIIPTRGLDSFYAEKGGLIVFY